MSKLSDLIPFHPVNFIWKSKVSSKVKAFAWLAAYKKANNNHLFHMRRPSKALSLKWCILCRRSEETSDHQFLYCPFTLGLWHKLFYRQWWCGFSLGVPVIWSLFLIWFLGTPPKAKQFSRLFISLWSGRCGKREMLGSLRTSEGRPRLYGIYVISLLLCGPRLDKFKGCPLNLIQLSWLVVCTLQLGHHWE